MLASTLLSCAAAFYVATGPHAAVRPRTAPDARPMALLQHAASEAGRFRPWPRVREPTMMGVNIDMAIAEGVLPAPRPPTALSAWEIHKFGGASLATAQLYRECGNLLIAESARNAASSGARAPTMAVVSAKGGVTDQLIAVVDAARVDMRRASSLLRVCADAQVAVVREISGPAAAATVEQRIRADEEDIVNVVRAALTARDPPCVSPAPLSVSALSPQVRAVSLLKMIPPSTLDLVTGYGEVWSAMTMHAYLDSQGVPTAWLDAREVLVVETSGGGLGDKGSSNTMGVDGGHFLHLTGSIN